LFGNEFVAIALFFFAFTTIMAYYYYAETNLTFIVCSKYHHLAIFVLRIVFLIGVYMGSVREAKMAWIIADVGSGMMAWVNIIAILLLGNTALKVWKDYKTQKKNGIQKPTFDAKKLNIKNADFWEKKQNP